MNAVGEIMHFADRNFYCDWWNANNIDTFWRSWNMPVHRWCVRHLYIPVVDMGYSRSSASLIVFFISAFFHEYLVRNRLLPASARFCSSVFIVSIPNRWAFHWRPSKSGHLWAWWARYRSPICHATWKCITDRAGAISWSGHRSYSANHCALWCTITTMSSHISTKLFKMLHCSLPSTLTLN